MKANEAFPARETNPTDVDKLEGYQKMAETSSDADVAGPLRSTRGQANEAWALYKSNLSRVTWSGLSSDLYVTCPKLASPTRDTFAWGLLVFHLSKSQIDWDFISCLLSCVLYCTEGVFEQIIMKLRLSFKYNNNYRVSFIWLLYSISYKF